MFVERTSSKAPWTLERGVEPVLARWLASNYVKPCLMADATIASAEGLYAPLPEALAPELAGALRERRIDRLYSHQARAFEATRGGKRGFVVATPTASGKSLCFHLPVLQAMAEDPDARAIYIFPTKALARDQEVSLRDLASKVGAGKSAIVYDGDTPADARRAARERGRIIITNPDMLHAGILPHHTSWARTMQRLEYVVVDEMHMYKGVFGSHVANVLRRLLRVAQFHGSRPKLVGATATIGNPLAHAARLFGVPEHDLDCISESGAPRGERRFFLFNPPVVNAELGIRASYVKQAVMLAADLVRARVPTLVFGHSRNNVEVMLRYLRDKVDGEIDPQRIQGYRGGYLPGTRRAIEEKLRAGEILAVVATNALELGIDIGELDAVICAGYPGSVAGTWQRFGRAGRRGATSICVLVTSSAPVDQYLAREPDFLLGAGMEEARIDPGNVEILIQHLKCAAFELPFRRGESFGGLASEETADALGFLAQHKVLHEAAGTFHWATDAYPANNVSLRSVGWDNVVIIDVEKDASPGKSPGANEVIAELDWRSAHTMLHEQAIYQHDGECWQVERLDYDNHKAFVRKVEPDYFTDAMTNTQVSVLENTATGPLGASWASGWGEVAVVEKVVGYKKIKFFTHENAGYGDVRLPEMQMHTQAFWVTVPELECTACSAGKAAAVDGLRGIGKALETIATLALMCDPRDIGATMGDLAAEDTVPGKYRSGIHAGYSPTLFLYEHTPGGTGLSERIFEQRDALLRRARDLIARCPCVGGCPSCVGPADANATHPRKSVALELLHKACGASSESRAPSHA
jgi:DEAD/DEAH box helicase domain-containing protein